MPASWIAAFLREWGEARGMGWVLPEGFGQGAPDLEIRVRALFGDP